MARVVLRDPPEEASVTTTSTPDRVTYLFDWRRQHVVPRRAVEKISELLREFATLFDAIGESTKDARWTESSQAVARARDALLEETNTTYAEARRRAIQASYAAIEAEALERAELEAPRRPYRRVPKGVKTDPARLAELRAIPLVEREVMLDERRNAKLAAAARGVPQISPVDATPANANASGGGSANSAPRSNR